MCAPQRDRRGFFGALLSGLWSLIAMAVSIPAGLYLLHPSQHGRLREWTEAGDVEGLTPNAPKEMVFTRTRLDGWRTLSERTSAWAVRLEGGEVIALAPQCTHLGCAYHWEETKKHFVCPCHTSLFTIDGAIVEGPAPRPLDRYDAKVENGKLFVGEIRPAKGVSA